MGSDATDGRSDDEPENADGRSGGEVLGGIARGFGGALIFGIPMLMTMELWDMGHTMDRARAALLVIVFIPLLVGVAHRIGYEKSFGWREDLIDTFLAFGIGIISSIVILLLFGALTFESTLNEWVGGVATQSVSGALGALLGRSQFGKGAPEDEDQALSGFFGTLFLMLIGAMFLSLNVAPTEEMVLISYRMTPLQCICLIVVSLLVMEAFISGEEYERDDVPHPGLIECLIRRTLTGYVMAILLSVYVLWTFGRFEDLGALASLKATIVLAFPAAIGASAARLIL
jgi:putative integral membrane protein (TIGR02587 family)